MGKPIIPTPVEGKPFIMRHGVKYSMTALNASLNAANAEAQVYLEDVVALGKRNAEQIVEMDRLTEIIKAHEKVFRVLKEILS